MIKIMKQVDFTQISKMKNVNSIAKNTFVSHLGIKITKISKSNSEAKLRISNKIMAPNGFIHGGAITSLADTACGFGTMYHLNEGEVFATIELKTNFISTVKKGSLLCKARLIHKGKTIHIWDANIIEEKSLKKIAAFRCTQMIIPQR